MCAWDDMVNCSSWSLTVATEIGSQNTPPEAFTFGSKEVNELSRTHRHSYITKRNGWISRKGPLVGIHVSKRAINTIHTHTSMTSVRGDISGPLEGWPPNQGPSDHG